MTDRVEEIKPPRGAILSVEKLIHRTTNGGVVYGVWCLDNQTTIERLTDARRTDNADSEYVVRLSDGTLEKRFGLSPCILVRSLDNEEEYLELLPMAYSALNLDGPVYRQCFAFSLQEQAEAFAESQKSKIPPPVTKLKDYSCPGNPHMISDRRAELEILRQIARSELGESGSRTVIDLEISYCGDKYASREYFYGDCIQSPRTIL